MDRKKNRCLFSCVCGARMVFCRAKKQDVLKDGVDKKWRRKKETENRPLSPVSSTNESTVMTDGGTSVEQKKRYPILSYIVIVVAVGLIVAGILNGGLMDVLEKAKKICMECIGLG